jgi:hypothetical protein
MDDHGLTILLTIIAGLWGMALVVCQIVKRLPAPRRRIPHCRTLIADRRTNEQPDKDMATDRALIRAQSRPESYAGFGFS